MKYKILRDDEPKEVTFVIVYIGLERYRLTETADGKLNIIKVSDGDSGLLNVHPRTGNVIELS